MKLHLRATAAVAIIILLAVAGLVYTANERISQASASTAEALESTLRGHRTAQTLKSLASGYELAMNEYYSTVLDFPVYRRKTAEHQSAISQELATLEKLKGGDAQATAELGRAFKEMETYRLALEAALAADDKDWDAAREALFKINVVSVRAIQQTDVLSRVASERATALDRDWQSHQAQAATSLHIAMGATLLGALLIGLVCLRKPSA